MKTTYFKFNTTGYGKGSKKPEDYDFKGIGDSLVNNAIKRLNEAKSPAPQVSFEPDISDNIYDNTGITGTNYNFLTKTEPVVTLNKGADSKNNLNEAYKQAHPEAGTKGIFNSIPDEAVEKNISVAENTINTNIEKGLFGKDVYSKFPNLLDGLAISYAAADTGNSYLTNQAYKLAYTEQPSKTSDNKNEGNGVATTAYDAGDVTAPVNYSYDQNENKSKSIYENNPTTNPRNKDDQNIKFSKSIPAENPRHHNLLNSLVPDDKNCLTLDDKKEIFTIKVRKDVSTEHAKIMYFSEQWKDVPEVKWTIADFAYWMTPFGGEKFIHSKKLSFIENYKDVIIDAATKYDIPPLLVAGVVYREFGGDPMFFDDMAYGVRSLAWSGPDWMDKIAINKNPDLTSYGNTSIQVRRAIEMLGYDKDTNKRNEIIKSLKDPIQNIYMTACHLDVLRNIDFAGKSANELTEDENKIIASRYNIGPEPRIDQILTQYGQDIYDNKDDILDALTK